jgi:uncharacterized protein (DUF924 family)
MRWNGAESGQVGIRLPRTGEHRLYFHPILDKRGVEPSWEFRTHDVDRGFVAGISVRYDAKMTCGIHAKTENVEPTWVGEVIRFWFEELEEAHWFTKSDVIDAQIRDRFLTLHERLVTHDGLGVTAPRPILALVIVLDQFSRNLYRGNSRAFSADSIARRLSRTAIEQGFDIAMKREERYFLYLPFEHSEDREDQTLALNLIKHLANAEWTRYAMAHKVVIDRFGRFPHRNAVLNRLSTADEIAFLKERMRSF